jgi:HSP20 family protein
MCARKRASGIVSSKQRMDRPLDHFFEPSEGNDVPGVGDWAPSLDLSETTDLLIAKVDIPGLDPKDIQVSVQDQVLTVTGEKKQEKTAKDERFHRVERRYGALMRAIRLPAAVDGTKVGVSFENGVLTVTLPKAPAAQGPSIPSKLPPRSDSHEGSADHHRAARPTTASRW